MNGWAIEHTKKTQGLKLDLGYYLETGGSRYIPAEFEGDFLFTPPLPGSVQVQQSITDEEEMISLVPYGCTNLRISVFPFYTATSR